MQEESNRPVLAAGARPLHAGLIVQRSGRIERMVAWDSDTLSVGRSRECDLPLPQEEISRRHAQFVREGDRYEVRDLGSVNGTWVNDRRVEQHELQVGDIVRIETFELTFVLDHHPIEAAMKTEAAPAGDEPVRDAWAMTMIEEVMPVHASEPLAPQANHTPRDLDAVLAAERDLAESSAEDAAPCFAVASEPWLDPSALPEVEEKELSCETASGPSSRASSVQRLGSAPSEDRIVTLEVRLRWSDLPEALREALQQVGDSAHPLPVELGLRVSE